MGYPTLDEVQQQCSTWEFIAELPAELNGFVKELRLERAGQILFICSYVNRATRKQIDLTYTTETFDYILCKKMGLNEYRDIRFIFKEREVFAKEVFAKLPSIIQELSEETGEHLGYLIKDKGILDWEYGNSLPAKIGDFELYIKPNNAVRYLNGSVIFLDYSDFARQDQLVILYNILRDEIFAERKVGSVFQTVRDFDVKDFKELEKRLKDNLVKVLDDITKMDHEI